nr:MAG TPA: hypothetical protein [Caudoviricetes sp.]
MIKMYQYLLQLEMLDSVLTGKDIMEEVEVIYLGE